MAVVLQSPMGPGFFIFFQEEEFTGSGGAEYGGKKKRPARYTRPLAYYEELVKKLLEKEKAEKLEQKRILRRNLEKAEKELGVIAAEVDTELKVLLLREEIAVKQREIQGIKEEAKFLKDKAKRLQDDELALLLLLNYI